MLDEPGKGTADPNANGGNAGGSGDNKPNTETKPLTEADVQREADRRVNEAHKKWKADLDAAVADKTKDAETKLAAITAKAEEASRYASFLEAATTAGIRNARAAYAVAVAHGQLDGGKFNAEKFKTENPEFFAPMPNANAGAGAGKPSNTTDVNDALRSAFGITKG